MEHCNVAITLVQLRLQLTKNEQEQEQHEHEQIWYLCNTILDLVFSVKIVRKFMDRPKVSHLAVVKRILRYLNSSIGCKIMFPVTYKGRKYNLL